MENRNGQFVYDYEHGKQHAYIAYFRRGTSASQSIRLYEHPTTPPVFPTLHNEVVVRIEDGQHSFEYRLPSAKR